MTDAFDHPIEEPVTQTVEVVVRLDENQPTPMRHQFIEDVMALFRGGVLRDFIDADVSMDSEVLRLTIAGIVIAPDAVAATLKTNRSVLQFMTHPAVWHVEVHCEGDVEVLATITRAESRPRLTRIDEQG